MTTAMAIGRGIFRCVIALTAGPTTKVKSQAIASGKITGLASFSTNPTAITARTARKKRMSLSLFIFILTFMTLNLSQVKIAVIFSSRNTFKSG